jgi:outer membrane biosynthesis protein TonB
MSFLNNLFMILILLSILIIILGLIRPSMIKMRSRKNAILSGVLLFIVSFVLFGVTAPDETEEVAEPKTKQSTEDKEEAERLEAEEKAEKEKAEAEAQKAKELEEQKARELEEQKRQEELAQQQAAEEEKRRAEEEAALKAKQEAEAKAQAPTPTVERFQNCTEMRKVHPNGVPSTHPAYEPKHDRDKDNHACEQ